MRRDCEFRIEHSACILIITTPCKPSAPIESIQAETIVQPAGSWRKAGDTANRFGKTFAELHQSLLQNKCVHPVGVVAGESSDYAISVTLVESDGR